MGPGELDPIAEVRKKRLAKGTWKAERRRLLALEKKVLTEHTQLIRTRVQIQLIRALAQTQRS